MAIITVISSITTGCTYDFSDSSQATAEGISQLLEKQGGKRRSAYDPAVACIIILPFRSPKAFVKFDLKCLLMRSLNHGCPPNLYTR